MKQRKYTSIVTAWNRAQLGVLALALAMTSTRVEIPGASAAFEAQTDNSEVITDELKPTNIIKTPEIFPTELPIAKSLPKPVTKIAPTDTQKEAVKPVQKSVSADVPTEVAKPVTRKKWNTVNAPDLETKLEYSAEEAIRTMVVPTTAYTSDPGETDSSPFTTADGSQVRDGIVAANFLPHGTRIRIPDYFGNKVFEVHDRMNSRYQTRVDIWMLNKSDAFGWGVRNVKIEILP